MTCPHCAEVLARLERIERLLSPTETPDPLIAALAATYGNKNFTSGEAMCAAARQADDAAAQGLRLPDLPHALQVAGIETAHALGRWLAGRAGRGVDRIGEDRTGVLWRAVVSRGGETARPLRAAPPPAYTGGKQFRRTP